MKYISHDVSALPSILSASTLKPSSLVISNFKCGCSLFVGHSSSSSDGGGSSSEVESAPNKTQLVELKYFSIHSNDLIKQFKLKNTRVFLPVSQSAVTHWFPSMRFALFAPRHTIPRL